jgi:recombination protein RecA
MASKIALHPKLARVIKMVDGQANLKDVMVNPSFRIDCINTGSTVMNMLIGGSRLSDGSFVCPGWPRGHIVEIYGRESSGKTTIALTAMAQAISANGCGLYVDLECAVKDHYAMKLGVDFRSPELGGGGRALRASPHTFEETEAIVMSAALNGVDIIVIDSVAGLVSRREISRNPINETEKLGVAEIPRLMSGWMPKLQQVISRTKTLVIFLNQTRDKIGAMGYTEEAKKSTTGGNALKFWAAIRMMLKPKQSTKAKLFNPLLKQDEDVQISNDIEAKMIKNKIDSRQGHSGLITIRYGVGVDEMRTMLNVALAYGVVKSGKNSRKQDIFSFTSPSTGKVIETIGIEKFRMQVNADKDVLNDMLSISTEHILQGFKEIDDAQLAELSENAVITSAEEEGGDEYEDSGEPSFVEAAPEQESDIKALQVEIDS